MPKVFGKSNTRDLFCDEIVLQGWPIFLILDELEVAVDAGLERCTSFRMKLVRVSCELRARQRRFGEDWGKPD
jgi:predicted RNA-binding protein associated with RNAse of E/G family